MALPIEPRAPKTVRLSPLPNFIFASRWLQLPLYLGLILAQCVYVFRFWVELVQLVEAAFGNQTRSPPWSRARGISSRPSSTLQARSSAAAKPSSAA